MVAIKRDLIRSFYELAEKHGLRDWRIQITPLLKYNGLTYFQRKLVKISSYVLKLNPPQFAQLTLLHEISHCIAYQRYGCVDHGPDWQRVCAEIGGEPGRGLISDHPIHGTSVPTNLPQRWKGECCGRQYSYHLKRVFACEGCGRGVVLNRVRKGVAV